MKFTLLSGSHGRFESVKGGDPAQRIYKKGDVIDLTDEEARSLSLCDRIEPVAGQGDPKPQTRKGRGRR